MSVTVRLWSDEELDKAYTGEDLELSALLMNRTTFDEREMQHYPYHLCKRYRAIWDGIEPVELFAPNDEMSLWFIKQDYTRLPDSLCEVITRYRNVELPIKED